MIADAAPARTEVDCRMMRDPRPLLQSSRGINLAAAGYKGLREREVGATLPGQKRGR
jgi:hypothetical protein